MRLNLFLLIVFLSNVSFAQMKVYDTDKGEQIGVFKTMGTMYAELIKYDDVVVFTYRDEKFEKLDNYKKFSFYYSDIDTLYSLFIDFNNVKKGDSKTVELDNGDTLTFEYKKMLGKTYAKVFHHENSGVTGLLRYMTNKQIDRLFDK